MRALVLSHGLQLLLVGTAIGLVVAFALSRVLQSLLFQVESIDLQLCFGVGLLLFAATLLAAWIPARRATLVNPIEALRAE
jgi:ABC-type lipoprotein release transport system permease subunit